MQHASLSPERWSRFRFEEQVLMIANEMQRALSSLTPERRESLRMAYERVLRLVDLSVACTQRRARRRELLLWRDVIGALYVASGPDPAGHAQALRCLLQLTPESARQIPSVGSLPPIADER